MLPSVSPFVTAQVPTIPFFFFAWNKVVHQPLGVVLIMSPWNFPFSESGQRGGRC